MKNFLFVIYLFCLVFCTNKITAQNVIPDNPSGQMFIEWLKAFNSHDSTIYFQFLNENSSEESKLSTNPPFKVILQDFYNLSCEWGELKAFSAQMESENEISVITFNKSRSLWVKFYQRISKTSPYKIIGTGLKTINKPKEAYIERLSDNALAENLDKYLKECVAEDIFSGTVLIAKEGKPIFAKAYGYADRENKILNTVDTKFNLASINKMMTAVAIIQLIQNGKLNLDDVIAKHLPDYQNKEVANKVTIHHLLTHTSGLGDVFTKECKFIYVDSLRCLNDWFQCFIDKPLAFEPGEKMLYSNAGFLVLGAIIEKISGTDYYTYISENITKPLGMNNTAFYSKTDMVTNMAKGYITGKKPTDPKTDNESIRPFRGTPFGLGYSTVEDMLKFAEALRNNKILTEKYVKIMTKKRLAIERKSPLGAGYGCYTDDRDKIKVIGHEGGIPGVSTNMAIFLKSGYTVVILSNYSPEVASLLYEYIRYRIQAKK